MMHMLAIDRNGGVHAITTQTEKCVKVMDKGLRLYGLVFPLVSASLDVAHVGN